MRGWTTNEKYDWDSVSTSSGPPEPGIYLAEPISATPEATKTGKPAIKVVWSLKEDADGNASNRKVFDTMVLTQAAAFRIKMLCDATEGLEPLEDNSFEAAQEFCEDLLKLGRDGVYVKVTHRPYQTKSGQERVAADIDRFLNPEEASEQIARQLNGASRNNEARANA